MTLDNSLLKQIKDFKSFIANMIPIAGNNIPNADTTNGNVGNSTTWARSDHSHPKSSLYAEASHAHNEYLTSQDIVNKVDKVAGKDLSTNDFTDSYKDKLDLNFGYVDHNLKLHFVEVDEATLSSSPNVAMNGGITNIMAHITDSENNNVIDAPIDFYQDNVYYDTGITNNNGLASIEYFGNGIGQTNFTVKCGNFVSQPYIVYDCLKYDDESKAYENSIWTKGNNSSNANFIRQTGYTEFSEITTGTDIVLYTLIDHSVAIEFDVQLVGTDYAQSLGALGQSQNANTRANIILPQSIRDGNWHHIKITFTNGTGTIAFDNGSASALTINNYDSTLNMYFRFVTNNGITGINFKNWKCYPI